MAFNPSRIKLSFPLWHFLNQPVFDRSYRLVLNPQRFHRFHKIKLLERCWMQVHEPEGRHRN